MVDGRLETLPPDRLREHQWRRFRALAAETFPANPFLRRKWQAAGVRRVEDLDGWDAFRRLPFTAKQELAEDQAATPPFGTNLTYPLARYVRVHQTSGTTGAPIRWLETPESWAWWARCWASVFRGAGVTAEDRVFFPFSFGLFVGFWAGFEGARALGALAIPGGGQDSPTRLHTMEALGATVLVCTPSYALHLIEVARERGLDLAKWPVRVTVHAGEPGAGIPAVRARIEAGELVLTNLGRAGSPAVRYRSGDRVRLSRDPCPCGRTFLRFPGGILGRVDDMLTVRGVNVFPAAIEGIVRRFPEVDEFLIEVYRRGTLEEVRLLVELTGAAETGRRVHEALRADLGIRIDVVPVPLRSLPRYELKARRVVLRQGHA